MAERKLSKVMLISKEDNNELINKIKKKDSIIRMMKKKL